MDEETKWVVGGIGLIASLTGLWQWALSIHRRAILQEQQHNELLRIVQRIYEIDTHLDDMLKHPDDSGFGVGNVSRNQQDILGRLDRIESFIRNGK